MDRKSRKVKSVDGFVPSKLNSPLSNPFDKINKAKLGSSRPGIIPHRKATSFGNFNEGFISTQTKASLGSVPINPSLNPAMVSVEPDMIDEEIPTKKITRRERKRNQQLEHLKKKKRLKRIFKYTSLVIVSLIVIVGGYLGFKFFHNIDKVFGGNVISNFSSLFSSTTLNGESTGRVNILVAGDSADQLNHGGAELTDSIVLVSIDTQNNTAFMLSIPRDLWVNIPGMGNVKINAANDNTGTHFAGYAQNGMGILQHIVTTDLGIPIDYYALSDYGAFREAVNAVGGVSVNIQSPDPRGLYDSNANLKLPNGSVFLNGQEALNLARARGDGYNSYGFPNSDFDRTEHQRQLFTAIAAKAKTIGVLTDPIKIGDLFDTIGNNVETNLSLKDVLQLIKITKNINLSKVQSFSYCATLSIGLNGCNKAILTDYTDPASGQEAIIPVAGLGDYTQMQQYYNQLTSNNPVVKEDANIVILNGGGISGLAGIYQTKIDNAGGNVTSIGDAPATYPTNEIINNSGGQFPATLTYLESIFGKNLVASTTTNNPGSANFVVIIGANQKSPTTK